MRETNRIKRSTSHGEQIMYRFPNGYGASVIRNDLSYGGSEGLWELAVLDVRGDLTYDTPITDNVIGYLDEPAVDVILRKIEAL